jgi:ubiquinone/menaquinone biosynthesis C-methylase UbiE
MSQKESLIDVGELMARQSVEEHCRAAEEYFARLDDWSHHLAKPFASIDEAPQLLINLAILLQGLALCPGMTVLEFGAGTCWLAHALTQMGCRAIAVDASETALRMGQELYARHPPFGEKPATEFLHFDGRRLDLKDNSVDRVICLDAFHHVPNPAEVLNELGRVLVDGGIAGFAEPGPQHSTTEQSQYEMRMHGVIENDVDVREIWRMAQAAGFSEMKLSVFNVPPFQLSLTEFEDFIGGGRSGRRYLEAARGFMQNQRDFFLYKGQPHAQDSRYRLGLTAQIRVSPSSIRLKETESPIVRAAVTNTSEAVWLPKSAGLGAVHLGCHVYHADGSVFRNSFHWEPLTPGDGGAIEPGETIEIDVTLPRLPRGTYVVEFDMVSNDVCWFAVNGSETPKITIEVV